MTANIELLHTGGYSCVISRGTEVRTFTQRGVADLYDLLVQEQDFLNGAKVADKVIGKAAAALLVLGGVQQVYADVISEPAVALLQQAGIPVQYGECVHHIINRTQTGWCPMEEATHTLNSPTEIFEAVDKFVRNLRTK